MKNIIFLIVQVYACLYMNQTVAQGMKPFSLKEIIEIAQQNSIASRQVQATRTTSFWEWRVFQSNNKPQLTLDAIFPSYNRSIIPVTQPDGSISYESVRNNTLNIGLGLTQRINATGGTVTVGTSLQRFDDYNQNVTQYNSTLFYISLSQPIIGFNPLKWDIRIEPLRFKESQQQFVESFEKIAFTTTEYFFNQLLEQVNLQIAETQALSDKIRNVELKLQRAIKLIDQLFGERESWSGKIKQ